MNTPDLDTKGLQSSQNRLFLERRGYRKRRILDAARVLPILGLLLWLVPLVWPSAGQDGAVKTSTATIYVFVIWCLLIAIGAFLAAGMKPAETQSSSGRDTSEKDPSIDANTAEIDL